MNIRERPEGLKIASIFIAVMVRGLGDLACVLRSAESRIDQVELDASAVALLGAD